MAPKKGGLGRGINSLLSDNSLEENMSSQAVKLNILDIEPNKEQARKQFDYIFLDAPAGVDAGFRLAAKFADRFLVVTGAGPAAVRDAARVSDLLELMGKRNIRLIVNRVDRDMLSTIRMTVDDVMDSAGLPLMGIVLEDPNVTLAAAFGQPLLQYSRRRPAAKAFRKIANRLQGFHEPITLR